MNKKSTCCFTGHRPEKLGLPAQDVKAALNLAISSAIQDGFSVFISGMSRGVDLWAAEIVLKRKRELPLTLIGAIPYPDFPGRWAPKWQELYQKIYASLDDIPFFSPAFSYPSFQKRNLWMVHPSSRLIAVYNGSRGGTYNTLLEAKKQNMTIVLLPG